MVLFEALINNLDEAVFLFDPKSRLLFANKAGEEFFGRGLKELQRRRCKDLFSGAPDIAPLVQKVLREGRSFNCRDMEIDVGRTADINVNIAPFYSAGTLEGALLCIRENLSMASREDYHFETLLYLLGSIAHEIKNPLSGIKGAAQILRGSAKDDEARECVDLILKESDRLNQVLQSYLTMTRTPVFNRLNIHEVIEHALRVMEPGIREAGVEIEKSYDPSLPLLRGDESKLLQVFINILKNALEAMEAPRAAAAGRRSRSIRSGHSGHSGLRSPGRTGKLLGISTRPSNEYMLIYSGEGPGRAQAFKKQRWAVVTIRDTGSGIAASELSRIFLPFYTKKPGGSGLGLALSKKIIKDHGGLIKVKSAVGSGTTVTISLPLQMPRDGEDDKNGNG